MRTQESKDRLMNMVKMRLDGYTLNEIAEKYGVSKQCVQQHLSALAGNQKPRPKGVDEKIVYPNLAKWIAEERIARYELSHMLGLSMNNTVTTTINKRLYGEVDFSMAEIKKLIEVTGQTFEYLFAEKENQKAK